MLERLIVRNYKSLEDMDLRLRACNVFVGPNNAGKSNILDCLQFLSDFFTQGAGAIHGRGGFGLLVWNGDLKRTISIQMEGKINTASGPSKAYKYLLGLAGGPTHYSLVKEVFTLRLNRKEQKLLEFPSSLRRVAKVWEESGEQSLKISGADNSYVSDFHTDSRGNSKSSILGQFASNVRNWHSYNFVPSRMRSPLQVRRDLNLQTEGDNLPVVLHSLYSEFPKNFNQVTEVLRHGVPELRALYSALSEAGGTYISVEETGIQQRIPAWAMSDGTLKLLAHLAVVYSPSPPALVCFEEPENFLHPHLLELLAQLLQKASERTQILVTTHSPYLLNFLESEDLIIVEKSQGKTTAKRASERRNGLKEALRVLGLGEMWYAGSLGGIPKPS